MKHNLTNVKLTDDEIKVIFQQYKESGPSELREKLILAYVGLASSLAQSYRNTTGLDSDDLQGEALLAVTDAINRCLDVPHDNIGGYVSKYIHQYLRKWCKSQTKSQELEDTPGKNNLDLLDIKDSLDYITQTSTEASIIDQRLKGLTDNDIAERLGRSEPTIRKIRTNLYNRFKRIYK